jgi:hypothetical protein
MQVRIPGHDRGGFEGAGRNRGLRVLAVVRAAVRVLGPALVALVAGSWLAAPAAAGAAAANRVVAGGKLHLRKNAIGSAGSAANFRWACPEGACQAIVVAPRVKIAQGSGERRGLDPQDLQSAYNIPTTLGEPQTIALIDAFGYPDAESDLAKYRKQYGLPACTKANGCFKKVNESGEEGHYPAEEPQWDVEAALDEDMASAACPQCHILLVEGSGELPADLGKAVDTAVKLGATEVSNSYGYPEKLKELCGSEGCAQYDKDYEHPEVLITAAAGDDGYADAYELSKSTVNFPAASPDVVAVGGTALFKEEEVPRKWFEEVWNEPFLEIGTGSGCAKFEPKPAWQTDTGCHKRTDNDVAAVAAAVSPVSVRLDGVWELVAGTSVASPLVAGIEAHASAHERSLGARMFYEDPSSLYDITQGFNWNPDDATGTSECAPNEYLCNAEVGYDGPTGLGTPDGVPVESAAAPPVVTMVAPDAGPARGGKKVRIEGTGFEGVTEVKFGSAAASDVTVHSAKLITAKAPAGTGTVNVTVTTSAGTSATGSADEFTYR